MNEKFREHTNLLSGFINILLFHPVLVIGLLIYEHSASGIPWESLLKTNIIVFPISIIIVFIPILFNKMVVVVTDKEIIIRFGMWGWIRNSISLSSVTLAEVVKFRPIRDFGGWGIRIGRFQGQRTGCYSMSGNRGVLLTLSAPIKFIICRANRVIIASRNSDELLNAVKN